MRIISRKRLRQFWQAPNHKASEGPLRAWYQHVKKAQWTNFADIKADFPSAGKVGSCVVFNIAGNKYRLITVDTIYQRESFHPPRAHSQAVRRR